MAIERTGAGGFVVTGEHIQLYQLKALAQALALEITTGMHHSRGSTMKRAAALIGSTKRTKRGVLADLVAYTEEQYPGAGATPSVLRAAIGTDVP